MKDLLDVKFNQVDIGTERRMQASKAEKTSPLELHPRDG
jgi:hypothetical protein